MAVSEGLMTLRELKHMDFRSEIHLCRCRHSQRFRLRFEPNLGASSEEDEGDALATVICATMEGAHGVLIDRLCLELSSLDQ
jgi:hypothetical protein